MPRPTDIRSILLVGSLAGVLAASAASATVYGWRYGKWHVVLGSAEDIVVLAQDGRGIDVEVRSEGPHIRFRFDTARCRGRGRSIDGAYSLPRAKWDGLSAERQLQQLKDKFKGWQAEADAACPSRKHRLSLKKLEEALVAFDGQLARGAP